MSNYFCVGCETWIRLNFPFGKKSSKREIGHKIHCKKKEMVKRGIHKN